jgi:hypothetical protein
VLKIAELEDSEEPPLDAECDELSEQLRDARELEFLACTVINIKSLSPLHLDSVQIEALDTLHKYMLMNPEKEIGAKPARYDNWDVIEGTIDPNHSRITEPTQGYSGDLLTPDPNPYSVRIEPTKDLSDTNLTLEGIERIQQGMLHSIALYGDAHTLESLKEAVELREKAPKTIALLLKTWQQSKKTV